MQRLVRVAAIFLVLHFTMDTADGVVEARTAEDLSLTFQYICHLEVGVMISLRTRSTM